MELKLSTLPNKGNIVYKYSPFKNFQTKVDLYLVKWNGIDYLISKNQAINNKTGKILTELNGEWVDNQGNIVKNDITKASGNIKYLEGSLIDLDTEKLKFDLNHPVDIEILPSYDGSVNLILNDGKNIPRLINSRFSVREKNTYEIVDRIGENDTNIYTSDYFDKDTSLYFLYQKNPIISFINYISGDLQVGLYCFYFTYCDSDDNESDFIAESGLIPAFVGTDKDPNSMDGGIKNQNSNKGILLKINNLDKSFNYLKIYYVRYFADYDLNRVYECKKLYQRYPINSNNLFIYITGNEETEDIDGNLLNVVRFNPKSVLTLAQCKNMLFFGNIVKNTDNYKELQDCALRILPEIEKTSFEIIDNAYETNNNYGYYDSSNIYLKVGYFPKEYYRFGVVFIYLNGTLSNVYNTLGLTLTNRNNKLSYIENSLYNKENESLQRLYLEIDDFGWITNVSTYYNNSEYHNNINSKGVCYIDYPEKENTIFGIKFNVPNEIKTFLKEKLGIRGLFFVRQKRIPNNIALCLLMGMDDVLHAPVINSNKGTFTECFIELNDDRTVSNIYSNRLYNYNGTLSKNAYAAICPDFLLYQSYYNQIFNGSKFRIIPIFNGILDKEDRMYNLRRTSNYLTELIGNIVTISSVTENVSTVALNNKIYKLEIGKAEEVYRFGFAEEEATYTAGESNNAYKKTNLVRGMYSPYLAVYSEKELSVNTIYNIYRENYIELSQQEFQNRMGSSEPFYAISDRYNFDDIDDNKIYWRGDCYLNKFTYRLNRNFNDPSLPNNDLILEPDTWKDNYTNDSTDWTNISRSDVNAVRIGSWITFPVRSYMNYALRSLDHSYVAEEALMGSPRSYYPRNRAMYLGNFKLPDSYLYNDAYRASLGFKCYFTSDNVNYIKDTFSNRILYSAISILDSYKNNYRYSLSTYFRDYSLEYGGITKLVGFEGYLLVVFEHAVGLAVINERVLAGGGDGEPVFINTQNVLPEELTIISDTYGTLWTESVVKSEAGYVYGVDTVAKKIWRVKGLNLEILSDFKVNKFLIDNISLGEKETQPIIGLKNVKTHYNNNKKDLMFTFYDDLYKDEEKVWNLCFNELLETFVTFYSWVPSYSENIDTQFFSFDRNSSKYLTLLGKCNYNIPENTGILLDNPVLKDDNLTNNIYYRDATGKEYPCYAEVGEKEKEKGNYVLVSLEKDRWKNYDKFKIDHDEYINCALSSETETLEDKYYYLLIHYDVYGPKIDGKFENLITSKTETVCVSNKLKDLNTGFYLHGNSGTIDSINPLRPTFWYEKQHPFEFEFVVSEKIGLQKIFSNLILISNKAEPESFHFEIEGDNYDFSSDKRTMYYRLELTKQTYYNLGSDIIYDREFEKVGEDYNTKELYYRKVNDENYKVYPILSEGLVLLIKSSIFPLYYNRIDKYDDIYDEYQLMTGDSRDYLNLSGSEIVWNKDLNLFNVVTHIKNSPIDKVGVLRGNSKYKEGKWNILIPSIIFNLKNEESWTDNKPPLVLTFIPEDILNKELTNEQLPNTYSLGDVSLDKWTSRKEARIRDKWIKIKIRYSGKNLAVIHSIATLYNISYS